MENKTAVEWLIEQIEQEFSKKEIETGFGWIKIKAKALELEKQQHKKSFEAGEINAHKMYYENAEQYYSETYKKTTE